MAFQKTGAPETGVVVADQDELKEQVEVDLDENGEEEEEESAADEG